ncbi:uncharacterized protein LOC121380446 [Gigantopelta aegis]|uniref:uncharacterized protein LOC121380446 n=1 Tax=Gigantopelta aegis TaxID=1735272 RepID=UPI001B8879DC|nr:uncharacterized protein LOC121380446 [Gigantopelta aegis]
MGKLKSWFKEKAGKVEEKFKSIINSNKKGGRCDDRQSGDRKQVSVQDVQKKYCMPDDAHKKKLLKIKAFVTALVLPCLADAFGKSAGKLPKEHYRRVRENYTFLLDSIDGKRLAEFFFQTGAFDLDDLEEVNEGKTRRQRAEIFTRKVFHSGEYGYNILMHALIKEGYYDVIEKLEYITFD